jgi:hypothetical protein
MSEHYLGTLSFLVNSEFFLRFFFTFKSLACDDFNVLKGFSFCDVYDVIWRGRDTVHFLLLVFLFECYVFSQVPLFISLLVIFVGIPQPCRALTLYVECQPGSPPQPPAISLFTGAWLNFEKRLNSTVLYAVCTNKNLSGAENTE